MVLSYVHRDRYAGQAKPVRQGLSLGVPYTAFSLVGDMRVLSKLIIIAMMVRISARPYTRKITLIAIHATDPGQAQSTTACYRVRDSFPRI